MNYRLLSFACAVSLTLAATATGCFARYSPCPGEGHPPDNLSSADLVGTYRSTSGPSLTLLDDGTFTASGWPVEVPDLTGDPEQRSSSGMWNINLDDLVFPVSFDVDQISDDPEKVGYGTGLYVAGTRKDPYLFEFTGDPDICDLRTFTQSS